MAKKAKTFNESDVEVLKGLDIIRKKTGMYIGTNDDLGLFTILREGADNVADEFEAGRAENLVIVVNKDGSCEVHDDGQGMPVGKHKTEGISTLIVLTGYMHAGGKLGGGDAYQNSRGTHGIGIKATNALSESFVVETFRDKKWWRIKYEKGELIEEPHVIKKPQARPFAKGTSIYFTPDMTCFIKGSKLQLSMVDQWCDVASYLTAGLKIRLDGKAYDANYDNVEYYQPDGLAVWLDSIVEEDLKASYLEYDDNFTLNDEHVEIALAFTDADGIHVEGYTNGLYQPDGGVHLSTVNDLIYAEISSRAGKRTSFDKASLLEGMVGVINFRIDSPKFSSQTKEKLSDGRFAELCSDVIATALGKFFGKNKELVATLIERASSLASMKADFKASKKASLELKKVKKASAYFNPKISRADKSIPFNEREVFLVEGDSAGGGARTVKAKNQTVVPMKGKLVNCMKTTPDKFMMNEEVLTLLSAIGYDPDAADPIAKLECGKIILLSDSDPDGGHINALELTCLYMVIPRAFEAGLVFAVKSPRYSLKYKDDYFTSHTVAEMEAKIPKGADIKTIVYLKGWGEVDPTVLRDIALRPGYRQLIRINAPTKAQAKEFEMLMGENAEYRRKLFNLGA